MTAPLVDSQQQGGSYQPQNDDVKVKSYVLDTSVLLADPKAMFRFAEHQVVLPIVVISELEKKRHHAELGFFARQALRFLDELRDRARESFETCPRPAGQLACGNEPHQHHESAS